MLRLSAATSLALLCFSSLVDAVPATASAETTITGVFPSVTNADGSVNPGLFRRNVAQTFAKYDFTPRAKSSLIERPQKRTKGGFGKKKKRCTAGCEASITLAMITQEPAVGEYTADVSFGTPAQTLPLIFDTGSSDVFVQDSCAQGAGCSGNFDPSKSSTFSDTGATSSLSYVSDTVNGRIVSDTVTLAGKTIDRQEFLVVPDSHTPGASGNMGFGLNAQSNPKIGTTLLENLRSSGQLGPENSFSLRYHRSSNTATVTLGAPMLTAMNQVQPVQYPELLGRWALNLRALGNQKAAWNGSVTVFMDTGSTVSFLPRSAAKVAHATVETHVETIQLPLQGKTYDVDYYFFPCDTPPSYILNFGPAPRRTFPYWSDTRYAAVGTAENGMCQSALNGVDIEYAGLRAGILGAPWLKNQYLTFGAGSDSSNTGAAIGVFPNTEE